MYSSIYFLYTSKYLYLYFLYFLQFIEEKGSIYSVYSVGRKKRYFFYLPGNMDIPGGNNNISFLFLINLIFLSYSILVYLVV